MTDQTEFHPCRTTRHCADHGWCHRCDAAFADVMSRVNAAIQSTDPESKHWGRLYTAIAMELRKAPSPALALIEKFERAYPEAMTTARAEVRAEAGDRTSRRRRSPSTESDLRSLLTAAISRWHRDPELPLYEQGADAVLAVLPAPDALSESRRLALSETLGLGTGAPWNVIQERVTELQAGHDQLVTDLNELSEANAALRGEAEYVATPCSPGGCEAGGEPCTTHERLMAHCEDDHELCDQGCGTIRLTAEARPWPSVTSYVIEVHADGEWVGVSFARDTLEDARATRERIRSRRLPDARLRIVRWDETSTVVEVDPVKPEEGK